jgi:4-aminobutyrate aminotransferase
MALDQSQEIYDRYFTTCLAKASHLLLVRGDGPFVYTDDGAEYIDFVQGIAVNALGHSHPKVINAATEQIKKMSHGSFNLANFPSTLALGKELNSVMPAGLDMFFLANTGAEAVEGSLKLARYVSKKPAWIAFKGGFHGRTMGAASVTSSSASYRKHYAPFVSQVYFAPYPYCYRCAFGQNQDTCGLECLEYLKEDFKTVIPPEDVSAILFEPVQGEGGYVVPPQKYVEALRQLCDDHDILLICDEVQTGVGRTGNMFAFEHFDIKPDILCLGKAIGAGFPLAVVAASKDMMRKWDTGAHGTTFGGNPLSAAVSVALLEIIKQPKFLRQVTENGEYFRARLTELAKIYTEIGDVRGLGLMNAIELVKDNKEPDAAKTDALRSFLYDNKVLILPCGVNKNVLRFIPPLNVERNVLDRVLQILNDGLSSIRG